MGERDDNRLGAFRQLKKEIRGSQNYLIVGIDVAKERHHAFFGTAGGRTLLRRLVFENCQAGFNRLLTQVEVLKAQHGLDRVVFGLEPTANYHKPLGEYLIKLGETVVLVSGVAVKRNRELLDGRWDKHDVKDSANVADLISQGKCLYYELPGSDLKGLRDLLSLKRRLKRLEHGYRVRIRNHILAQYFPELDRYYGSPQTENIVRWCLSPAKVAELDLGGFIRFVAPGKRTLVQEKRLRAIWTEATESIGCELGEAVEF